MQRAGAKIMFRLQLSVSRTTFFGAFIYFLIGLQPVFSSGFAMPESSAAGLGLANAIVANPDERGAFSYNPAAMGFHEESSVSIGSVVYGGNLHVDTQAGSLRSPVPDWIATPTFQSAIKLSERWRLGLGVNAPFGLETRWRLGTFPMLSVPIPTPIPGLVLPAGLDHPTQSKLEVVAVVPTVTYVFSDDLSLSAGIDYLNAREATLNTTVTGLDGDGDGWGWNLSALYRNGPWSLGAAFHSAATIGIEGRATSAFPVPSSLKANVDLDLPWRLQLGARYAFNDQLAVEIDWNRTGWSEFEELSVKSSDTGIVIKSDRNDWDDANAYRVGMTYDVRPETRLRLGYAFDQTGQPDAYFTPRIPDSDRHLFSIGVGQSFLRGWSIDAAYTYVHFEGRDYQGTKPFIPTQSINGTVAVSGDYELSAHVFALEVSKGF
jgi:long-chain fatty acid transport protein